MPYSKSKNEQYKMDGITRNNVYTKSHTSVLGGTNGYHKLALKWKSSINKQRSSLVLVRLARLDSIPSYTRLDPINLQVK